MTSRAIKYPVKASLFASRHGTCPPISSSFLQIKSLLPDQLELQTGKSKKILEFCESSNLFSKITEHKGYASQTLDNHLQGHGRRKTLLGIGTSTWREVPLLNLLRLQ